MMLGEYHDYFVMMVAQLNLERGVGASHADFLSVTVTIEIAEVTSTISSLLSSCIT